MSFTTSAAKIGRKLLGEKAKITRAAIQALNVEVEQVATKSKRKFAPKDEGRLRQSIIAIHAKVEGRDLVAYIVAGGPGIPYAISIHEHRSEHSPRSWGGVVNFKIGGVKYIELPLMEQLQGMDARIAAVIKRAR